MLVTPDKLDQIDCLYSTQIEGAPTRSQVLRVTEELGEDWIYFWDDAWEKED